MDESPLEYAYTNEARASDWEKEIGQRYLIKQRTVNLLDTMDKVFGKKANLQEQNILESEVYLE